MKRLSLLAAVPFSMIGSAVLAQSDKDGYGWNHPHTGSYGYGHDGGWMFLGPLFMILILGLIVAGIVAFLRRNDGASNGTPDGVSAAMATLNQRLAKGEIDAKEYAERKALLQG